MEVLLFCTSVPKINNHTNNHTTCSSLDRVQTNLLLILGHFCSFITFVSEDILKKLFVSGPQLGEIVLRVEPTGMLIIFFIEFSLVILHK